MFAQCDPFDYFSFFHFFPALFWMLMACTLAMDFSANKRGTESIKEGKGRRWGKNF